MLKNPHNILFIYSIVQEHTKIAGAFAEGSEVNNNANKLLGWFTVCPGSNPNEGPDTFELCIAGHDDHRLCYDSTHRYLSKNFNRFVPKININDELR